ncbi:MAG: hypothetical protein BGO49_00575 [Planctomycetales bacterium 71-10]|nr:MAG: hypothetical protein BGO49_00575 [Planctomycetales bacterium 71-10]
MLDGDDPCVATSGRGDEPGLVCVDVDYEGEQSGSGVDHVRGLLLRLSALAVRPTIFHEGLDGESAEQYLGGTRAEARSALAAEAVVAALDDLLPGDLRDVVEVVLVRWRDAGPGSEYRHSDRG